MTDKEKLLAEIDKCLTETSRLKELVTAFIENVEEDEVKDFTRLHITEETFNVNEDKDWHLKDVLVVPVDGETKLFRVEHISDDKIYFVAVDAVGESNMKDMNQFLDGYISEMPKSLVDRMIEIEHKMAGEVVCKGKLTLLSYANVVIDTGKYELDGYDDISFDGLLTDAERIKNNENGETYWYWLDTPDTCNSELVRCVGYDGDTRPADWAASHYLVVPCFALPRRR